jgi:simple sugar transport system permease protein
MLDVLLDPNLYSATLRSTTPILLAALAGMWCERVGVFNMALDGKILIGAFFGVVGSYYTGSFLLGVLTGCVAGALVGALMAVASVTMKASPIVVAVALNAFAVGLTGFLLATFFGVTGTLRSDRIVGMPAIDIPFVKDIPWLGEAVSGQTFVVYLSLLIAVASWWVMYRLPIGLRLRGVGEAPEAARSLGVGVARYQIGMLTIAGALCGMAGAQLSLGAVTLFTEQMSGGRGWLALVAMFLGAGKPVPTVLAAFLFGIVDSLGFAIQGGGVPSQLTDTLPFVMTLLALIIVGRGGLMKLGRGRLHSSVPETASDDVSSGRVHVPAAAPPGDSATQPTLVVVDATEHRD